MKSEENIRREIEDYNTLINKMLKNLPSFTIDVELLMFAKALRDNVIFRDSFQAVLDED